MLDVDRYLSLSGIRIDQIDQASQYTLQLLQVQRDRRQFNGKLMSFGRHEC